MNAVWKYELSPGVTRVEMPWDARPLTVAWQVDSVQMWAAVDDTSTKTARYFLTLPTGEVTAAALDRYVGTVHGIEGWMVFHVFEVPS